MQTNRDALAQLTDDIFEVPQETPQETPQESPQLTDDIFQVEPDPFPVEQAQLTPREWILQKLLPSAAQNLNDMWQLVQPVGRRASENITAVPGLLDLARLTAEASHRGKAWSWRHPATSLTRLPGRLWTEIDERLLGGMPQEGDETPMADAMVDYLTGRYDFTNANVRAAFTTVLSEDPVGVITDLLTIPSLAFGGGAGIAKGATTAAKAAQTAGRAGRVSRFNARMGKALGWTQRANRIVNQGFHIPLVPAKIVPRRMQSRVSEGGWLPGSRFEIKTGIADVVDPGVWALRGAGRAISRPISKYAGDTSQAQQEALVRQGFTDTPPEWDLEVEDHRTGETTPAPDDIRADYEDIAGPPPVTDESIADIFAPLSLQNTSDALRNKEAQHYESESVPVIEAVQRAAEQLETRVQEILDQAHTDGRVDIAARQIGEQYAEMRPKLIEIVEHGMKRAGAEPGLVMDMRNVYHTLTAIREQDAAVNRLLQDVGEASPFGEDAQLRALWGHVERAAQQGQNMLSPDMLTETAQTTPVATASGQSASQVEDALYGTPTRKAIDLNTGKEYDTTYRVMEFANIIVSHTLDGQPDARYQSDLQVKDMSEAGSKAKVQNIARNLIPDQVLSQRTIQQGAPILNQRDMSISGAHRLHALEVARLQFPDKHAAYVDELKREIPRYGLTDDVDSMTSPVLVRVLDDQVDELSFARAGNVGDVSQLSESAQATQDLQLVSDELLESFDIGERAEVVDTETGRTGRPRSVASVDDAVKSSANEGFRTGFIGKLSDSEKPQFIDRTNQLGRTGLRRLRNAITAKVFSGEYGAAMRRTFTEMPTQGFKNIQTAVEAAVPALIGLRKRLGDIGAEYDIAEPLAEAVMKIRYIMEGEQSGKGVQRAINTYLDTQHMDLGDLPEDQAWRVRELDERGRSLLRIIALGVRRPSALREFLRDYSSAVLHGGADAAQTSLIDNTQGLLPPEEYVDSLVQKHLGEGDALAEGLDELFEGATDTDADADAAADAAEGSTKAMGAPQVEPERPILLENVIAYRNALQESLRNRNLGPRLREWRTNVINSLSMSIFETLQAAHPERAERIGSAMMADRRLQERLNSDVAQLLESLTDGSRRPNDPAVQRAMESFFTPDDTPNTVFQKYKVLGGFHSEGARRVRRIFLGKLFGFIRTAEGQADAARVARGAEPVGERTQQYRPDGIHRFMNQFSVESTNFDQSTLRAILGKQAVDDLNDLDIILQNFGNFMRSTDKNELFFGERVQRSIMQRIMSNFAWAIGGGGGAVGGFGMGGVPGSIALGVGGFLIGWLGPKASQGIFNLIYSSARGRQTLLNGVELAMRDAWNGGMGILLRTGRTVSKRDDEEE